MYMYIIYVCIIYIYIYVYIYIHIYIHTYIHTRLGGIKVRLGGLK